MPLVFCGKLNCQPFILHYQTESLFYRRVTSLSFDNFVLKNKRQNDSFMRVFPPHEWLYSKFHWFYFSLISYSGIISFWASSKSSWSSNCYSWNWSRQRWNSSQEGCPSWFTLSKTLPCLLIEQQVASPAGHRCMQCLLWAASNFHPANHCKSFESIGLYDCDKSLIVHGDSFSFLKSHQVACSVQVEQIPLPLLFMRTVLQAIGTFPSLVRLWLLLLLVGNFLWMKMCLQIILTF